MFTIRVYGICIDDGKVLVTDEIIHGRYVTKFPGGGLQFGEGTIECLEREMMEESGQEIEVLGHFYTTDFFQPSAFDSSVQVLSIYYLFRFIGLVRFAVQDSAFNFSEHRDDVQVFRWIRMDELKPEDLTLPIDRHVGNMLIKQISRSS